MIAADTGGRSPTGIRVFDRWNETEELLLDVERQLAEQVPNPPQVDCRMNARRKDCKFGS